MSKQQRKEYYREWEEEHREERNARRRELYREKTRKKIEYELANGIEPKSKKQRKTKQMIINEQAKEIELLNRALYLASSECYMFADNEGYFCGGLNKDNSHLFWDEKRKDYDDKKVVLFNIEYYKQQANKELNNDREDL